MGVFSVSIADDEAERIKGLAGVASLGPQEGKLFDFDTEEKWGIWMKGMKIPIDIIWLNEKARSCAYCYERASRAR